MVKKTLFTILAITIMSMSLIGCGKEATNNEMDYTLNESYQDESDKLNVGDADATDSSWEEDASDFGEIFE